MTSNTAISTESATIVRRNDNRGVRRNGLRLTIGMAAMLLVALVAVAARGQQVAAAPAAGTLKLVVEFNRSADARHDLAPAGDSAGDQVIYADPVFASNNRTRLGRAMFLNTFQEDTGVLVSGALRLRDGTITLAGARVNGAGNLAVTGGTGAYAGARGTYKEGAQVQLLGEDGPLRRRVTITFTR